MANKNGMYKIQSVQTPKVGLIHLSNNLKIEINLNATNIKFKNSNENATFNDLAIGDYVQIFQQGNTVTKAELQKEKRMLDESFVILDLMKSQMLKESPLQNNITSSFTQIRKIPSGIKNFTVAFMSGLIDYCVTYDKPQIFKSMKDLIYEYDIMRIDNPKTNVLELISPLFDLNEETSTKLSKLTDIYKRMSNELDSIFRSLIYITVKLDFYRLGTPEYISDRQEQNHYDIYLNQYLGPNDTLYLLERINIKLKVIDVNRSYLTSYASSSSNRFSLLLLTNGDYCNAFSQQESELRAQSYQERTTTLTFLYNLNSEKESKRAAKKEAQLLEIKEKEKQADEIMKVIQLINMQIGDQLNANSVIQLIKEPDLIETFKQYCCSACLKFTITYEFACSHKICYECYVSSWNNSVQKCAVCYCCEYPTKIYEFFNNARSP